MGEFHVVEQFASINGEGKRTGQLAYFIRFAGCNLSCSYCDTRWANEQDADYEIYDEGTLYQMIKKSGIKNVTLTGGEPLLQKDIKELLRLLRNDKEILVEVETNGSIDINPFLPEAEDDNRELAEKNGEKDNVSFTLDYKLPVSGMEQNMCLSNYRNVRALDTVKFVVGSKEDLIFSRKIIKTYQLIEKGCGIYLSPCFGVIEAAQMVEYLVEQNMNDVNIQLQLHKFIWDPDKRGV
ncbi:MAG: putative 7-carboxy-7-deazaguanine synthase QueE [Lachnospiraceae bacterium]|nr:putative 7-carboxy-7-deazaguanine synthase QueE [Lachnospiraceae bacterium]